MNRLPLGRMLTLAACLLMIALATAAQAEDSFQVVFDFESGDLQGWCVVEGQFAKLLNDREMFRNRSGEKFNKQGKFFLDTVEQGEDRQTGIVESPVFMLTGQGATFQIGGGQHKETYLALCTLDGKEVLKAQGINDEVFQPAAWDVTPYIGKQVFLRVVDQHEKGWGHVLLDDFRAEGQIDIAATEKRFASLNQLREQRKQQQLIEASEKAEDALRRAIEDLSATFPEQYTNAKQYLARLDRIQQQIQKATGPQVDALQQELAALTREALIANPLVSGQPIVYIVRQQYPGDHHNTATMFQTGEINTGSFHGPSSIKTVDFARDGEVKTLLEVPEGIARDLEVDFDGNRLLFALRHNKADDYHLYELNADGTSLTQLTFGSGITDIDPIYLPNGQIVFSSSREPKFCMCNRHIMCNLFSMEGDGANIQQIGHSTLHEAHPSLLADGRVIYDRWEYVDRNFGDAQGVWVAGTDGTNHAIYWGNNTNSPGGVLDNREIPGTELFIGNFSSCHDRPWGALAIVDRRIGLDGKEPVVRTWPADAIDLVGVGNYDTFTRVKLKYEDPYPLSDKYFLCSRMTGKGEQMGIYLLDLFGNEILLHTEEPGCFDPMPLVARRKPRHIPSRIDLADSQGYFYITDVYEGLGMDVVERGTVKSVRVVESPEKRFWTQQAWNGSGTQAPGMAYDDFNNKRILGTAPVEADGSAYFAVPADTYLYFQLLDENGMMVQSMRSGTIARPGETAGCVGCHENRNSVVLRTPSQPTAMRRAPSPLEPWYGPTRMFGYFVEVQPVFDKHCVSCHDFGKEEGEKLNLAGDLGLMFNTSYYELRTKKGLVNVPGAGPFQKLMPLTWGSRTSRLAEVALNGHDDPKIDEEINLDAEGFDRIVTWIDLNAPYYPEYASAYRENLYGRSPIDGAQLNRLSELTGVKLGDQNMSSHVSFTRPELSPCLAQFTDKKDSKYLESLDIIRAGQAMLASRPRADMPGFKLVSQIEIDQENKYQERLKLEAKMRAAIASGQRQYEKP